MDHGLVAMNYVAMSTTRRLCKPRLWLQPTDYGDGTGKGREENTQQVHSCGKSVLSSKRLFGVLGIRLY